MKIFKNKYRYIFIALLIISPIIIAEGIYFYNFKKQITEEYQKETFAVLNQKENKFFQKYSENLQQLNSTKRLINYLIENEIEISADSGKLLKLNAVNFNQSYNKTFVLPKYDIKKSKIKTIQEFVEQELYIQNVFAEFWQKSGNYFVRIASGKKTDSEPVFISSDNLPAREILKGNDYLQKNINSDKVDFCLSFPVYLNGKITFYVSLIKNKNFLASLNDPENEKNQPLFLIDENGKKIYSQNNNSDIPEEINPVLLNLVKTEKKIILNYSGEDLFLKYIPQFEFYLGFISDKKQVEEKISQTVKQLTELSVFLSLFLFLVFLFFDFNRKKEERSLLQSFSNIFSENRVNFNRLTEVRDYTERYYNEVRRYIRNIVSGNHNLNIDKKFKNGELISGIEQINNQLLLIKEKEKQREEQYAAEEELNKTRFEISEIIQQTNNIEEVSFKIIKKIAGFISADQIAFFISEEDFQKQKTLRMTASYAWSKERSAQKVLSPGEGLIGRAYLEKKPVFLTEIPDNYTFIESGFGFQKPNWLLIIPFIFNNEVQAIIEMAGINQAEEYKIKFLEDVGETIASAVANLKHSKQTEILLKQTTEQSVEIEEQRKTLEEKINTHRKQNRNLDKQILQLIEIIDSVKSVSFLIEYDTKGNIMDVSNRMINLFNADKKDFISLLHKDIITGVDDYNEKYKDFWRLLEKNKTQYLEETIKINGKEVVFKQSYVPIKNVRRKIYRVLSVGSIKE